MRARLFSIITGLLLMGGTIITVSAHAEIVLISGLELGRISDPAGRELPNRGGNSFIILEQNKTNCGPTSVEMVLHYYGIDATLTDVWEKGGIFNVDFGTWPEEVKLALNGLGVPSFWYDEDTTNYNPFKTLEESIRANRPPILLLRFGSNAYHYVVAVGYDDSGGGHYLTADPNGRFQWYTRQELTPKWNLSEDGNRPWSGTFGAAAKWFAEVDPYTMIVPAAGPTSHFQHYWAQKGEFDVAGKVKFFGEIRKWERTVNFHHPFDRYTVSMLKPLQWNPLKGFNTQWGHASITDSSKTGRSVKITGKIEDAWLTQGYAWVVVRTYSETRPLIPTKYTVTGITNNERIESGNSKNITVTVRTAEGTPVPGVQVEFIDSDDREIDFKYKKRVTNSSGMATDTLRTGSSGSANFAIKVVDPNRNVLVGQTTSFNLTVVKRRLPFERNREHKGTYQAFCVGVWYKQRERWTKYVDVPAGTIRSSVTVSETSHSIDRWAKKKNWNDQRGAYMQGWEWWDHDTVKVYGRITNGACWSTYNWVKFKVAGYYEGTASSRPVNGAPALTSELDTLSEYWQDLSNVPLETNLLTNYPNPFNPETWIPYQLAEAAKVHIAIYAADGKLVRSLPLGHQPAGMYTSHSRAAHWDGKNEFGEPVASGIYFYTLTAGEFTATRKMLILK